ncbi:MAG: hypothetical protein OXD30_08235 [Bryobacterales bacterium]|nr:hypothetical protein [Bryobacterales bacterium]
MRSGRCQSLLAVCAFGITGCLQQRESVHPKAQAFKVTRNFP